MPKSEPVDTPSAAPALPPTGTGVTSYTWGDSSGPWLIEEQQASFDYNRTPFGALATDGLTLSGCSPTYNLFGSTMLVNWNATVRAKKTTDLYATSAFQQNQKFEVFGTSTDYLGNTYGHESEYDASTMGVQGTVYSSKKFVKRILWDYSLHSANDIFNESVVGANYVMVSGAHRETDTSSIQSDYLKDFTRSWVYNTRAGTLLDDNQIEIKRGAGGLYMMNGGYDPNNETLNKLIQTIDMLGNMTTSFQFASMPPRIGLCGNSAPIGGGSCYGSQLQGFIDGCAHYDVNRHDYS